jgi:hypothetical protein
MPGMSTSRVGTGRPRLREDAPGRRSKGINGLRGDRVVHRDKELTERLGRNDPCPCGSSRRIRALLHAERPPRRLATRLLPPGLTRP